MFTQKASFTGKLCFLFRRRALETLDTENFPGVSFP